MLYIIKGTVYAAIDTIDADDAAQDFMACINDAFDLRPDFGAIQVQAVADRSLFREAQPDEN